MPKMEKARPSTETLVPRRPGPTGVLCNVQGTILPLPCICIGVDPGASGGLVALVADQIEAVSMPATERDVFDWFRHYSGRKDVFAMIERIDPRPTSFFDKSSGAWKASILRSTCLIYGHYLFLRGMLVASGIPFEEVGPKEWQKTFGLKRDKGEKDVAWKNRLKSRAANLFPGVKVTLAVADSILIAEHCRRTRSGGATRIGVGSGKGVVT